MVDGAEPADDPLRVERANGFVSIRLAVCAFPVVLMGPERLRVAWMKEQMSEARRTSGKSLPAAPAFCLSCGECVTMCT